MPISCQWADTAYYQQFDGTLNFTVTAPTKLDHVVVVSGIGTSGTATAGYQYWHSTEKVVKYYNGTAWTSTPPKTRETDGVIYYDTVNKFFHYWDGESLQYLMYGSGYLAFKGVFWYLKSVTAAPASPQLNDAYFNSSNQTIYWYNGFSWISLGAPVTTQDKTHMYGYMWYVAEEIQEAPDGTKTSYYPIYWYYTKTKKMEYRYRQATVYVRDELGLTTIYTFYLTGLDGKSVTTGAPMPYPGTDSRTRYRLVVNYTDYSGRTSGADYLPDQAVRAETVTSEYAQGRGGTINAALTFVTPPATYPTTDDILDLRYRCQPTTENTASVLIPLDCTRKGYLGYGVIWKLSKTGGSGGTFTGKTFAEAVTAGYLVLSNETNISINTYNTSQLGIMLRYPGTYTIETTARYRRNAAAIATDLRTLTVTIYDTATPALEVVDVTPDPDIYPPPYTVTLRDTSAEGNPYQIPQQSITLDAGDAGNAASWTLENTGSSIITMPDKVHVYDGYGPYRPSLTIVDMNGATTVGYAQFAPNKDPRIYVPPGEQSSATIVCNGASYPPSSEIAGDAPILLTGTAFVAGSPLPEVTWRYALDPASEYYQGEKDGAFAELSLLAGGTYDVTCTVMNGTTELAAYAWTATATAAIHPDTPVALQDFVVWVYDETGTRIDRIVPATAQYVDRFAHASYCELEMPIDYPHLDRLRPGCELAIGYLDTARLMVVTGFAEDADGETVTVTAQDAASTALSARVATTATTSTSGNGYDTQTCSAEALLRYFAVANIRTGNRIIPQMKVVGVCKDAGGRTTYSARYEDTLSIFESICTDTGLGWDSSLQSESATVFSLRIVAGRDHTYTTGTSPIIFEDRTHGRGSATIGPYTGFAAATVAIAAGCGDGSSRQYTEYGDTAATGLQRKEVFVDAGESADALEMQREAEAELKRQDEQTITVYPNESVYTFGVAYRVGDYVTVVTRSGIMLDLQIIQATLSRDSAGTTLSLECGSDLRDYQRLICETKLANSYARK